VRLNCAIAATMVATISGDSSAIFFVSHGSLGMWNRQGLPIVRQKKVGTLGNEQFIWIVKYHKVFISYASQKGVLFMSTVLSNIYLSSMKIKLVVNCKVSVSESNNSVLSIATSGLQS